MKTPHEEEKSYSSDAVHVILNHLFDELTEAKNLLRQNEKKRVARYESEETGELYAALAKSQMEMEVAKMESANPFFKSKYADLASIIKASRPYLAKNGLSVIQRIIPSEDGLSHLHTRLGHSSGQWMESRIQIDPVKKDIQSYGSYVTYLRRYSYGAMVGVVSSDEDDDGEKEMQTQRTAASTKPKNINKAQLQILSEELKGEEVLLEYVLNTAKVSKLSDLPEAKYTNVLAWVRDNKDKKDDE